MAFVAPPPAALPFWSGSLYKVKSRANHDDRLMLGELAYGPAPWVPSGFNTATDSYVLFEPLTVPYDDEHVMVSPYMVLAVKKCGTSPCQFANTGYSLILGKPDIEDVPPSVMGRYTWMTMKKVLQSSYYYFPVGSNVMVPKDGLIELGDGTWAVTTYGFNTHLGRRNAFPLTSDEFANGAPIARF